MTTKLLIINKKRDLPVLAGIILLIGNVGFYAAAVYFEPAGYIGKENIAKLQRYMALSAAADVCQAGYICMFIAMFAMWILGLYRLEKRDNVEQMPVSPKSRKWLISVAMILFAGLIVLVIGAKTAGDDGIFARLKIAVCAGTDRDTDSTAAVTNINALRVEKSFGGKAKICGTLICIDGSGRELRFPVSGGEADFFSGEIIKYTDCRFSATYYKHSHIIKEYSFDGKKDPSYIESQSDADKIFGHVEISWELNENQFLLCRPENIRRKVGWAVYRDGELVQLDKHSPQICTVTAEYYEKLDIDAHTSETGSYEIVLVYCNGGKAFRISDSIIFDIDEEWGDPVGIHLEERQGLPQTEKKELPPMPEDVDIWLDGMNICRDSVEGYDDRLAWVVMHDGELIRILPGNGITFTAYAGESFDLTGIADEKGSYEVWLAVYGFEKNGVYYDCKTTKVSKSIKFDISE